MVVRGLNAPALVMALAIAAVPVGCDEGVTTSSLTQIEMIHEVVDAAGDTESQPGGDSELSPGDDSKIPPDDDEIGAPEVPEPPAEGPALYSPGPTHSPLTPYVSERLRAIATSAPDRADNVFMKVGDSITVSRSYLFCFASSSVDLASHATLSDTLDFFLAGDAAGTDPFSRESESALGGRSAPWAIGGTPSPLELELEAVSPRFAVVMFGTNDVGYWPEDAARMFRRYGDAYLPLVDQLIEAGVVPILMSIPPRDDRVDLDVRVPLMNLVIRGVAQARQIPFVDFHREMLDLSQHGLAGDGVHPNVRGNGCDFSEDGLARGYNVRNLITLQALERVRRVVIDDGMAPDPPEDARPRGAGTLDDPIVIASLPFTHQADTGDAPQRRFDRYPVCSDGQDEGGGEWVYRLDLATSTRLQAMVLDVGGVDVDIHLLSSGASPGATGDATGCLSRDDTMIRGTLGPGSYLLTLDTFVSAGEALSGPYLLVVAECDQRDVSCDAAP